MVHATAEKKILTTRFANKGVEAEAGGKGKQIFFCWQRVSASAE